MIHLTTKRDVIVALMSRIIHIFDHTSHSHIVPAFLMCPCFSPLSCCGSGERWLSRWESHLGNTAPFSWLITTWALDVTVQTNGTWLQVLEVCRYINMWIDAEGLSIVVINSLWSRYCNWKHRSQLEPILTFAFSTFTNPTPLDSKPDYSLCQYKHPSNVFLVSLKCLPLTKLSKLSPTPL